jgi:purine catabolism regulator
MIHIHGYDFCCEPLRAGEHILGYIVIIGVSLSESDKATIKRATMALALEYSKSQALSAVEARFRGNFIEQVLSGQLADPLTVQQRSREFAYDLRNPQRATLLCVEAQQLLMLQTHFHKSVEALSLHIPWIEHESGVLCFLPEEVSSADKKSPGSALIATLRTKYATLRIVQGRSVNKTDDWKQSVQDAEQVRKLPGAGKTQLTTFDSIGVYQLLLPMIHQQDAYAFYRRHLGSLLDYDRDQNAELMQTLLAYFDASGSLARTSEVLHIHRNTLLYRLTRISQICNIDLENPDTRLSIWISVKFHALFHTVHSM